jgi:phosphate transport system substrate-binding protein
MRHSTYIIFSIMVAISLLFTACAPAATPPAAQGVSEPAQAPTNTSAPINTTDDDDEVNPGDVTGNIITAGSSTVYPLTEAVAELFRSEGYADEITIDSIGSGAGFERFCKTGETDIANASRDIRSSEVENCQAIGREPLEFRVGTDALAVVVHPNNDFLSNVTMDELALIFSDKTERWSDINADWPNELIKRYAPGTDSGTYDFFIEAVMQPKYDKDAKLAMEAFQNASNLQKSEDDNVLVQGVQGDRYAIGFFGFAYLQANQGAVKSVAVDGVEPDADSAEDGSYPLARPLFIYSDATIMENKPQVASFIKFYLTRVNEVVLDVGYFPASDQAMEEALQILNDNMQ